MRGPKQQKTIQNCFRKCIKPPNLLTPRQKRKANRTTINSLYTIHTNIYNTSINKNNCTKRDKQNICSASLWYLQYISIFSSFYSQNSKEDLWIYSLQISVNTYLFESQPAQHINILHQVNQELSTIWSYAYKKWVNVKGHTTFM